MAAPERTFTVTLVRPPVVSKSSELSILTLPPIGLAYIAAALRQAGIRCVVVDAVGEALDRRVELANGFAAYGLSAEEILDRIDPASGMIGVACTSTKEWRQHRELLLAIKRRLPGAALVCGGEHVTALPEFSLADCNAIDYCVLGEGEETAVELAGRLAAGLPVGDLPGLALRRGGKAVRMPRRARIRDVDSIPVPAWDLFPIGRYIDRGISFGVQRGRTMPMLATRGCPYRCTFCSSRSMWQQRWIPRSPECVVDEMLHYRKAYGATNFDFYDLTVILRKDWILRLAGLIRERCPGITWQLPSGTRAEAVDDDVCRALYLSNCRNISFSPENASSAVLDSVKKRVDPRRLLRSMRAALKAGLVVKANLIFGFPGETHHDIRLNLKYIVAMSWAGVHDLSIWAFAPYPGSELFGELRRQGKIRDFDDAYIDSLIYSQVRKGVSWNDEMGVRWANFYRLTGYVLFYLTSLLFRPHRLVLTAVRLARGVHETRAETFLARMFKARQSRKAGART